MKEPNHMMHYTLSACRKYYVGLSNMEVIEVTEIFGSGIDNSPDTKLPKDIRVPVVDIDGKLRLKLPVTYYQTV